MREEGLQYRLDSDDSPFAPCPWYSPAPYTITATGNHRAPGKLVFQKTYANENVLTFCAQVSAFLKVMLLV